MSFERVLLAALTAFVLLAGVGCLITPSSFAEQAELQASPGALTEIRAFYGGLQIGIGVFLVWCVLSPSRVCRGLLLIGLAVGGAGLARAVGILLDHAPTPHHLTNLAIEAVTVVLVGFALLRVRKKRFEAAG